mgnify:CR=1 FL=1
MEAIYISGCVNSFVEIMIIARVLLEEQGIKFLHNEDFAYQVNSQQVNIIGVGSPDLGYDDLDRAVQDVDLNEGYNIILSHTYEIIGDAQDYDEIDLVLAGDTHGGQMNIPFITENLLGRFYQIEYLSGKYVLDNLILYVNRGLGTIGLPWRFNCRPEVTLIEIEGK